MDTVSPEKRSWIMSRVRSGDTGVERIVRQVLRASGFHYRIHDRSLPGRPDLSIRKLRTAIFVHGCFWHGHLGCRKAKLPASRTEYWSAKIADNQERDIRAEHGLISKGWTVDTIWECEILGNAGSLEALVARLKARINGPCVEVKRGSPDELFGC